MLYVTQEAVAFLSTEELNMILLKLLILSLTFNPHEMSTCPKGKKLSRDGARCEDCPREYYQDKEGISKYCKPCTKCDRGSTIKEECTKLTNTKCKCKDNFTPWDDDYSTCKCDKGYGLTKGGKCEKCQEGFFTSESDTQCKKWKECKSGVNISGTVTSDVTCNEPDSNSYPTTLTTSRIIACITSSTTQPPHGGAHTPSKKTTTATTTPQVVTSTKNTAPSIYTGNHIGMALIIFGIAGLLVLTVVTCKLHITDCWHRQKTVQPGDSLCSKPVEESCDGSQFPLKSNVVEP
ncbi:tumor necrosis factor receptor superfamily member 4 [Archocentrus centrarchus]|uniref:tumor necrosis factor receptor superfamily member 4 n=1 Tax=Archocentrus centrarchus TaxID=63155 RepID=UPI0011E9DC40|nr:tumor necrosis factor receptor superfamily member 4-like [Archocentrus centrarchus]